MQPLLRLPSRLLPLPPSQLDSMDRESRTLPTATRAQLDTKIRSYRTTMSAWDVCLRVCSPKPLPLLLLALPLSCLCSCLWCVRASPDASAAVASVVGGSCLARARQLESPPSLGRPLKVALAGACWRAPVWGRVQHQEMTPRYARGVCVYLCESVRVCECVYIFFFLYIGLIP